VCTLHAQTLLVWHVCVVGAVHYSEFVWEALSGSC
jgi:hypothetical protein